MSTSSFVADRLRLSNVSFLNPFVLLALATVAVPLLLHLFNLRRPQRVDFSSLAFVKELQKSAVQRVRIKQWILLALRMLAIACLVLAFAQPTLTGGLSSIGKTVRTAHAIVVDNSLSMSLSDEGGRYVEQARRKAEDVIAEAGRDDEFLVWPVSQVGEGEPGPLRSAGAARDAVREIEAAAGSASLVQSMRRAVNRLSETTAPRTVVYVISDLQETALGDSLSEALPSDVQATVVPVGTRSFENAGVTAVEVKSRIAEVGQPVRLEATLVNYGTEAVPGAVASVYLQGERVAQATATLEPGQPSTVSFTATPQARGWLAGTVEIEDDAFSPDNTRHFTLHVPRERRVLVVRGEEQRTRYVDLALSSEMIDEQVAFQTETIAEADLPSTDLGGYDAVLLVGPRTLSSGEVSALGRYVDQGGGLLLFPNARARPDDYDALFRELDGGGFRGFSGELGARRSIAAFEQVDLDHPLFEGVFDTEPGRTDAEVESPEIYYAMNAPTAGAEGQTLIELSNGFPFLQELRGEQGVALVAAVAPDPQWSDLPVRGLFIPLLYRSVYYLSAGTSVAGDQLTAGRPGEVRVTGVSPQASLRLVGPGGVERVPDQRSLFGATLVEMGSTLHALGIYDLRAGDELVRRVALNLDPAESDLRTASAEAAASALSESAGITVSPLGASADGGVAKALRQQRAGTEIWNVFLMLALAFLVAEMLVARQWKPESTTG